MPNVKAARLKIVDVGMTLEGYRVDRIQRVDDEASDDPGGGEYGKGCSWRKEKNLVTGTNSIGL